MTSSSVVPSLGDLNAYINAVQAYPFLSAERERELGLKHRDTGDLEAAHELVLSHLRLVVSTSRELSSYGLPQGDLIQEGNIGLMKAVKKFDPDREARLSTYAMHWIKNEMFEYIIKNWRIVKIATTKPQRKLFWNLRSMTPKVGTALTDTEVTQVSTMLNLKESDVRDMEVRLRGGDVPITVKEEDDDFDTFVSPLIGHQASGAQPDEIIEQRERDEMLFSHIPEAVAVALDDRERSIIKARWMNDDEDQLTLQELGKVLGISAERVRQIESSALKKLRTTLKQVEYL